MPVDRGRKLEVRPRWNYVLNKSRIDGLRRSLRQIQSTFLFVKEAMSEATSSDPFPLGDSHSGGSEHFPITLTGMGRDSNGIAVSYSAQVMMQQCHPSRSKERIPQRQLRRAADLTALRQSPYSRLIYSERGSSPWSLMMKRRART